MRRFNEDYPLKISVEFAKAREVSAPAPVNYDFVELERAMEIKPFRNRLEKSKRYEIGWHQQKNAMIMTNI